MRVCTGGIEHVIGWNEGDIEKYEGDHDKNRKRMDEKWSSI